MLRSRPVLPVVLRPVLLTNVWLATLVVLGYWWLYDVMALIGNAEANRVISPPEPRTLTRPLALLVLAVAPVIGLLQAVRDQRWGLVTWFAVLLLPTAFIIGQYLSHG